MPRGRFPHVLAGALAALVWLAPRAAASEGDMSPGYCACLARCYSEQCGVCGSEAPAEAEPMVCPDHCARIPRMGSCSGFNSRPECVWDSTADARTVPWSRAVMGWTCAGDCKYECAREDAQQRQARSIKAVQYHGKWSFLRVAGIEELVSATASVGNALPHLLALQSAATRDAYAPPGFPQREAMLAYSVTGVNAWVWSTALHTKESWATERLDYHSAALMLLVSLWACACLTLDIPSASAAGRVIAVALACVWLAWVALMNWVRFDYGLNMTASVVVAAITNLMWCVWAARQGCCSARHPTAWKAPAAAMLLSAMAMLELLDFAPIGDLVDAHAMWHLATIPLCFAWYSFLRDHAALWRRRAKLADDNAAPGRSSVGPPVSAADVLSGNAEGGRRRGKGAE